MLFSDHTRLPTVEPLSNTSLPSTLIVQVLLVCVLAYTVSHRVGILIARPFRRSDHRWRLFTNAVEGDAKHKKVSASGVWRLFLSYSLAHATSVSSLQSTSRLSGTTLEKIIQVVVWDLVSSLFLFLQVENLTCFEFQSTTRWTSCTPSQKIEKMIYKNILIVLA